MWYKEQVQFAIMPRIFKGIRIGYKGEYSFRFELIHESEQGTITSAYPYISKLKASHSQFGNKPKPNPSLSRSKTHLQDGHGYFETGAFSVSYEGHNEYFNDLCIFKMEYKMKKNNKSKTYLIVNLMSHRKTIVENDSEPYKLEVRASVEKIYTRKLIINTHSSLEASVGTSMSLNDFIQVQLQDNDFFGSLYMYIGAVHLGWKIRDNKMNLCEFLCQDGEEKRKVLESERKYIRTEAEAGKCIKDLTRQYLGNIEQYYRTTIKKSISQTLFLYESYLHLTSQQHTLTILQSSISTEQQIYINRLQTLNITEQSIGQYFECSNVNSLYFAIHYENSLICDNVRAMWHRLLLAVQELLVDQFQMYCNQAIAKMEKDWKRNCVRFVDECMGTQDDLVNSSSHSILVQAIQHSRTTKNLQKPTKFQAESRFLRVSTQRASQSPILENRVHEIAKFKAWRAQKLERQKIISNEELAHPLFMIENFSAKVLRDRKFGAKGLVVFVHGFRGSEYDLEKASEYLTKYNENVEVLRISTLENEVDYQIEDMAVIVANEIKKSVMCSLSKIDRISIIGYSLGGIISRAALHHLEQFRSRLHIFVTFSSPHLGTYATNNSLVRLGIWYMTKFSKCTVLEQLHTCRDLKTSAKSYMKRLSEEESISWFSKVVLVSCLEDQFVPHLSSRVDERIAVDTLRVASNRNQNQNDNYNETGNGNKFKTEMIEMSENIRRHARNIERVEVWFDNENKKGTIDKLTGRQSHIEFLDNCRFLKWFFHLYGPQF